MRVTSHGRYETSTRLVPSHSGYGEVARPNSEKPRPSLIDCCVIWRCPLPVTLGRAGALFSEKFAESTSISAPPSWVPDSDISDDASLPA